MPTSLGRTAEKRPHPHYLLCFTAGKHRPRPLVSIVNVVVKHRMVLHLHRGNARHCLGHTVSPRGANVEFSDNWQKKKSRFERAPRLNEQKEFQFSPPSPDWLSALRFEPAHTSPSLFGQGAANRRIRPGLNEGIGRDSQRDVLQRGSMVTAQHPHISLRYSGSSSSIGSSSDLLDEKTQVWIPATLCVCAYVCVYLTLHSILHVSNFRDPWPLRFFF